MTEHDLHDEHVHLPEPTVWPFVMAAAITLMAAGFVLGLYVAITGVLLFVLSAWGWAQDLLGPDIDVVTERGIERVHDTERGGDV